MIEAGSSEPKPLPQTAIRFAQLPEERQILDTRYIEAAQDFKQTDLKSLAQRVFDLPAVHRHLYDGLCLALPQAIGCYRGTPGTPIEQAQRVVRVSGHAVGLKRTDQCAEPEDVIAEMAQLEKDIRTYWHAQKDDTALRQLSTLTYRFYWVHPFLDGNGHTWRLISIALARLGGFEVSDAWSDTQRPYGAEFSLALQNFDSHPELLDDALADFFH